MNIIQNPSAIEFGEIAKEFDHKKKKKKGSVFMIKNTNVHIHYKIKSQKK